MLPKDDAQFGRTWQNETLRQLLQKPEPLDREKVPAANV